jgi:hypothetical protein
MSANIKRRDFITLLGGTVSRRASSQAITRDRYENALIDLLKKKQAAR